MDIDFRSVSNHVEDSKGGVIFLSHIVRVEDSRKGESLVSCTDGDEYLVKIPKNHLVKMVLGE